MARKKGKRSRKDSPESVVVGLIVAAAFIFGARGGLPGVAATMIKIVTIGLGGVAAIWLLILWRKRRRNSVGSNSSSGRSPSSAEAILNRRPPTWPVPSVEAGSRFEELKAPLDEVTAAPQVLARPTVWGRSVIEQIEWKRFEELLEGYWKAKGYRAELTGRGADGGVDIRLFRPSDPAKQLGIIQCKSRSDTPVGVNVVRELFGVMHHEAVPLGILATTVGFTEAAREFAAGKHIQLWDGDLLLRQIRTLDKTTQSDLLLHVTRGDFRTPTCPSCDIKLVVRRPRNGSAAFYGCSNFPRCKYTLKSPVLALER